MYEVDQEINSLVPILADHDYRSWLQIMILKISGGKGCYLDNFNIESGKIMIWCK